VRRSSTYLPSMSIKWPLRRRHIWRGGAEARADQRSRCSAKRCPSSSRAGRRRRVLRCPLWRALLGENVPSDVDRAYLASHLREALACTIQRKGDLQDYLK
jgi:hypothetical protein